VIDEHGVEHARAMFAEANLRPAGFGLPCDWRGDEDRWRADLEALPALVEAAVAVSATRTTTWIMPASDEREFAENRAFHVERFTPIARVLGEYGCRLGLEFIGPKTLRDTRRFPFIYTMEGMLEMGAEIGPNVGLLLDAFHWYTSGSTEEALLRLRPEQVVYVHVNDARAGRGPDEQIDNERALPGDTGVIDLGTFLRSLRTIGYDGPVVAEPFKKELNDLPSDLARLETVSAAMDSMFKQAGIDAR
jgi:sugar phosphate isomerase/epimerase